MSTPLSRGLQQGVRDLQSSLRRISEPKLPALPGIQTVEQFEDWLGSMRPEFKNLRRASKQQLAMAECALYDAIVEVVHERHQDKDRNEDGPHSEEHDAVRDQGEPLGPSEVGRNG